MNKQFFYTALVFLVMLPLISCSKASNPAATGGGPVPVAPTRTIHVATSAELKTALQQAKAGDEILLADGVYNGRFVIAPGTDGTATSPIVLRGTRAAILDGGDTNTGYVLYVQGSYWIIKGFTVQNGLKGVMIDGVRNSTIDGLKVDHIGEEGIHLRKFSSLNTIQQCEITNTGLKTPDYGEGIYIGSAKNNWATYTNGNPDRCDSNTILSNRIGPGITAECIDIKEGTTFSVIRQNSFDATGITGANGGDSWIDVKGNYALIENNGGYNPGGSIFKDGYQVHVAYSGWGNFNEFRNNQCAVNATGYGFNIQLSGSNGVSTGNKVYGNNSVTGATAGIANIPLSN